MKIKILLILIIIILSSVIIFKKSEIPINMQMKCFDGYIWVETNTGGECELSQDNILKKADFEAKISGIKEECEKMGGTFNFNFMPNRNNEALLKYLDCRVETDKVRENINYTRYIFKEGWIKYYSIEYY